ncbi:MAG TPA: hypothetical protein VLN45_05675 [Ignavibacteriaceae bacterium]|nr:hypothetical protein [Ignavibacteriaceae bacterium]
MTNKFWSPTTIAGVSTKILGIFFPNYTILIFRIMKFLKILLTIIIFTGSLYPCADEEILHKSADVLHSSLEHKENGNDDCSSFCYCTCCSVSYSLDAITSNNVTLIQQDDTFYNENNYLLTPTYSIWQPPKIS